MLFKLLLHADLGAWKKISCKKDTSSKVCLLLIQQTVFAAPQRKRCAQRMLFSCTCRPVTSVVQHWLNSTCSLCSMKNCLLIGTLPPRASCHVARMCCHPLSIPACLAQYWSINQSTCLQDRYRIFVSRNPVK